METIEVLDPLPKHGGARRGAGAKKGYSRKANDAALAAGTDASNLQTESQAYAHYNKSRARLESAKADAAELDFKIKSGLYVERAAVREAAATAFSQVAQACRSIPDLLERRAGLTPEQAEMAAEAVDGALAQLADTMEMLSGPED